MSYQRKQEENRRLKKLLLETQNNYAAGAYFDEEKQRIIKYSAGGKNCRKFLKKCSNKKVRHSFKEERIQEKGFYKKTFDYWWLLF